MAEARDVGCCARRRCSSSAIKNFQSRIFPDSTARAVWPVPNSFGLQRILCRPARLFQSQIRRLEQESESSSSPHQTIFGSLATQRWMQMGVSAKSLLNPCAKIPQDPRDIKCCCREGGHNSHSKTGHPRASARLTSFHQQCALAFWDWRAWVGGRSDNG